VDWIEVVFNPSFPYRFAHMFTATYLTTSLVVLAVGARYWYAGRFQDEARTMMRMGLGMVIVLAPLQLFIGDQHGLNTAEYQPTKIAAMEAHWDSSKPGALVLFAWPDEALEENLYEIAIPNLASLLITHSLDGRFHGLKDVAPQDRPPVKPVFFAFRIMVGLGMLMILLGLVGGWLWWKGRLFSARWFTSTARFVWPMGFVAVLAGWWVTETGRQPWIAHGILRTADAVSPVSYNAVLTSLILFCIVYTGVFGLGIYYINRLIVKGPAGASTEPEDTRGAGANRPISAAASATKEAMSEGD
jgi:cytochrome d ubiquinol oxidase subunit I